MTASLVKANNLNEGLEKALRDEQKSRTSKGNSRREPPGTNPYAERQAEDRKGRSIKQLRNLKTSVDERCRKCDAKADKINELNSFLGRNSQAARKDQRAAWRANQKLKQSGTSLKGGDRRAERKACQGNGKSSRGSEDTANAPRHEEKMTIARSQT